VGEKEIFFQQDFTSDAKRGGLVMRRSTGNNISHSHDLCKAEWKNFHCDLLVTSDKGKCPMSPLFVIATTTWLHPDDQQRSGNQSRSALHPQSFSSQSSVFCKHFVHTKGDNGAQCDTPVIQGNLRNPDAHLGDDIINGHDPWRFL
jgi:hypothetical protein